MFQIISKTIAWYTFASMSEKNAKGKQPLFTSSELRIIGISLSILSLGLVICYVGFVLFLKK